LNYDHDEEHYESSLSVGLVYQLEGQRREDEVLQLVTDPKKGFTREEIAEKLAYFLELRPEDPKFKDYWASDKKLRAGVLVKELQDLDMLATGSFFSKDDLKRMNDHKDNVHMVRSFIDGMLRFYFLPTGLAYKAAHALGCRGQTEWSQNKETKQSEEKPVVPWAASMSVPHHYGKFLQWRAQARAEEAAAQAKAAAEESVMDPKLLASLKRSREQQKNWTKKNSANANGGGRVGTRPDRRKERRGGQAQIDALLTQG